MRMQTETLVPQDLQHTCRYVLDIWEGYQHQDFTDKHTSLLKVYFDLGQDHLSLPDYYRLTVSVPLALADVHSELYLCQGPEKRLCLVCSTERGLLEEPEPAPPSLRIQKTPYEDEESKAYVLPIHNKYANQDEFEEQITAGLCYEKKMLGVFVVRGKNTFSDVDKFFFVKYVDRISTGVYNRIVYRQNTDRWKFIRTLIADIEHNVILPNMYFRHLFNLLKNKINMLEEICTEIQKETDQARKDNAPLFRCEQHNLRLRQIHQTLTNNHGQIVKHYNNMSLFIESLFRKEHFERGHLVLRPKRCFLEKEVIIPQLEQYTSRLFAAKITIDRPKNMYEEEFPILVDIGLLSQVYANLFSNAAKYTQEIIDHNGRPRKAMSYGREIVHDFSVPGQKGIKCNVFTTGPNMSMEEGERLFLEGVRGVSDTEIPGTGLGLSFIRHVIEMHGGKVGYEPTQEGNNFYFILPLPPLEYPPELRSLPPF